MRSGDIRPCEGDIANGRPVEESPPKDDAVSDDAGSNTWLSRVGNGDRTPPADEIEAVVE